jgi:putative salt-induced outer membrane protein
MRVLCLLALLVFCPHLVAAQPAEPPPRREGSAEFAFVGTTGNASTQTIGLGGELINRPESWVFRNRAAFLRNKAESTLTAQSLLFLSRAERAITTRLAGFGEYGYFRDRFAGISHRNGIGAGLTYKLIERAAHLLSVDGALGFLDERRLVGPDVSSPTYGFGGAYRWKLSETATLSDDVRFTGTFDEGEDWRVLQGLAVTARLTQLLSLKVSNTINYVNAPVPGFKGTDTNTSIALVAKF